MRKYRGGTGVFTPIGPEGKRLRFDANDVMVVSGDPETRGRGKHGIVEIQGKRYKVFGLSCGLPHCMCDAKLVEVANG